MIYILIATPQLSEIAKKGDKFFMSKKDVTVLQSIKLAADLKEEAEQSQKQQQIEKKYNPPKWLLGRETLFKLDEEEDLF